MSRKMTFDIKPIITRVFIKTITEEKVYLANVVKTTVMKSITFKIDL